MTGRLGRAGLIAVAFACASPALAQDIVITNAKLVIGDGSAPIDSGTVVVRGGKIVAAGRGVTVPIGMESVDAGGAWVTPGIVAGFSRIGLVEVDAVDGTNDRGAEKSRFSAGVDIAPALNPMGSPVAINRAAGITRALVVPEGGASSLFKGLGAVVDLGDDMDMVTRARAFQYVVFGEDGAETAGGSRAATYLLFREQLLAARGERADANLAERSPDALLQRADSAAIRRVISGEDRLLVRVDRAADIVNVLKLKSEFPALKLVLVGATEGWLVGREIAAAGVPVLASALTDLPGNFDQLGATQSNVGRMKAAGVDVTIGIFDDNDAHKLGYTLQYAGNIVGLSRVPFATGLTWDQAFAAITSAPARAVGMDGQIGSLRAGRVGDIVVWDGDPLELSSRPTMVWIDGRKQSLITRQDRLAARYARPGEADLPKAYER